MSTMQLTKTKMMQGVWRGLITDAGEGRPEIEVTHQNIVVDDITLEQNEESGNWLLSIPIPAVAIADGVQTLIVQDKQAGEKIGQVTLMGGEALGDDIRAEMDLLRAELDMLKRAFRRHCLETG
ncbi:MAG: hypothetical protein WBB25_15880 [Sulfitobacter sp.]